jgi:hypothetical protein
MGWDGTDGNQPRGTIIRHNIAYRCGLFEKQSSFYFQAKSMENIILGTESMPNQKTVISGYTASLHFAHLVSRAFQATSFSMVRERASTSTTGLAEARSWRAILCSRR